MEDSKYYVALNQAVQQFVPLHNYLVIPKSFCITAQYVRHSLQSSILAHPREVVREILRMGKVQYIIRVRARVAARITSSTIDWRYLVPRLYRGVGR